MRVAEAALTILVGIIAAIFMVGGSQDALLYGAIILGGSLVALGSFFGIVILTIGKWSD